MQKLISKLLSQSIIYLTLDTMKNNYSFLRALALFFCTSVILTGCKKTQDEEWTTLLDKDLSQWRIYQSYENMTPNGTPVPNEDGSVPSPIGYDVNRKNVFSTVEENGELLLHINGKIYGCLFTKEDFRNYHLRLKYKFGTAKYEPRLDKAMDSGILYHSQGEAGVDYWKSWMLAQEFQVMEAGTDEGVSGDYWPIANARIEIKADDARGKYHYNPTASWLGFGAGNQVGNCYAVDNFTTPDNGWTTLELICYEGKSLHIVNGKVAMALQNSSYWNGTESFPLVEGKIQLQCEAAELYYKDIEIKLIQKLPDEYMELFD